VILRFTAPPQLPGRQKFASPLPAAAAASAGASSWAVGLGALATVASPAFAVLLFLNR